MNYRKGDSEVRVGIQVTCTTCGRDKKPHGRSSMMDLELCDSYCPGYTEEPKPGCLWPGETEEDFGYPLCNHATREMTEAEIKRRREEKDE